MYVSHTFLIRSSADGHLGSFRFLGPVALGRFRFLGPVGRAAVNAGVRVSSSVFSGGAPRPCGSSVCSCLKGISTLPSVVAAPTDIPERRVGGALFSTPSPTLIVCECFEGGCSDQWQVIPRYSFDLPSSSNE